MPWSAGIDSPTTPWPWTPAAITNSSDCAASRYSAIDAASASKMATVVPTMDCRRVVWSSDSRRWAASARNATERSRASPAPFRLPGFEGDRPAGMYPLMRRVDRLLLLGCVLLGAELLACVRVGRQALGR